MYAWRKSTIFFVWFGRIQLKQPLKTGCFRFQVHMDVSENSGTPKSSILRGFSIINHPFWGTPMFGNIHILIRWKRTSTFASVDVDRKWFLGDRMFGRPDGCRLRWLFFVYAKMTLGESWKLIFLLDKHHGMKQQVEKNTCNKNGWILNAHMQQKQNFKIWAPSWCRFNPPDRFGGQEKNIQTFSPLELVVKS